MKVGSLVELIDDNWSTGAGIAKYRPVKNKVYTVRAIEEFGDEGMGILLEEIINPLFPYADGVDEPHFKPSRFRELLPPIENIEENINEDSLELEIL